MTTDKPGIIKALVPLSRIVEDHDIQIRGEINSEVVKSYEAIVRRARAWLWRRARVQLTSLVAVADCGSELGVALVALGVELASSWFSVAVAGVGALVAWSHTHARSRARALAALRRTCHSSRTHARRPLAQLSSPLSSCIAGGSASSLRSLAVALVG